MAPENFPLEIRLQPVAGGGDCEGCRDRGGKRSINVLRKHRYFNICQIVKEQGPFERSRRSARHWSARRTSAETSHDDRLSFDGPEWLAVTFDPDRDALGRTDIDDHDMILTRVHQVCQGIGHAQEILPIQPALENRQLQPDPVPFHGLEYLAPTPGIGDVVTDKIHMVHTLFLTASQKQDSGEFLWLGNAPAAAIGPRTTFDS